MAKSKHKPNKDEQTVDGLGVSFEQAMNFFAQPEPKNQPIPITVITKSDNTNVLVFIYDDITWANRKYIEFGEQLNASILSIDENQVAIQFQFINAHPTFQYVFDREQFHQENLSLLANKSTHLWTSGYYDRDELVYLQPLKPLAVRLW